MSCGEPIDYSKPFFAPAGFSNGRVAAIYSPDDPVGTEYSFGNELCNGLPGDEEINPDNKLLSIAEVQQRHEMLEKLKWANTPLDELDELSELEYFQRRMIKGLKIPESYFDNLAVPFETKHMADRQYVDDAVAGQLFINTKEPDQLLQYDGNDWGIIKEFDLFTVEMVREPLSIGCEIRLSNEDRYDKAMEGI